VNDQETGEGTARQLMDGIAFLSPSEQCVEALVPFACLFVFQLCDSKGHLHTVLRKDCLELRDDICAAEWNQAVTFLGNEILPVCEDLPNRMDECIGMLVLFSQLTVTLNNIARTLFR
jgi:hypothetical protein